MYSVLFSTAANYIFKNFFFNSNPSYVAGLIY
ncbi:hypothetical protein NC651_009397 [Populus alba x Populus x berolinensis]|nr:hypothetical protein NC651_009397 [Populus alba x Populus x berolinensis]